MHVSVWISCFILQVLLVDFINGGNSGKRKWHDYQHKLCIGRYFFSISSVKNLSLCYQIKHILGPNRSTDDNIPEKNYPQSHNKVYDVLTNPKPVNEKDYFLPLVFPNTDDDNAEEEDDEDPYVDYDYEKEINYKDSPTSETVQPGTHEQEGTGHGDKIPLHTAKDNLPIFLLEPENTYVVKNKPATLKCRAANTLEVSFLTFYSCQYNFIVVSR